MIREGSLDAPTRRPIEWETDAYWDEQALQQEMERVFDACHGCRRCVSLCESFPNLFDLVDESPTLEVDGVDPADFGKVVDQCYLCDLCYMTKCPYVPPHEWNIDFPHLMLRAKAVEFKKNGASLRDKVLTATDTLPRLLSIPLVDVTVNAMISSPMLRKGLDKVMAIDAEAPLPKYHRQTLRHRAKALVQELTPVPVGATTGKLALYATCYGNYNSPELGDDFITVFQKNGIAIKVVAKEHCCGMPKLELGDLESVRQAKSKNIPVLAALVDQGYDLTAPVPSCVLMYKQELPLLFPDDEQVLKVKNAFYDPFEYLHLRHKQGHFNTNFEQPLGDISYQLACHMRVQNIGVKARDLLKLVPNTRVEVIERCSGHDGTYAVKSETRAQSVKIARPVVRKVNEAKPDHFISDCPMAAVHIDHLSEHSPKPSHPMTLLRQAYGLE